MKNTPFKYLDRVAVKTALLHQPELTQTRIAEILSISPTYLSALINGTLPIPKDKRLLRRLADILRVRSSDILDSSRGER